MSDHSTASMIRELRKARGTSMRKLAVEVGLSNPTTLLRIESGARPVTLDEAVRFAQVFGVTLNQLAGIEEAGSGIDSGPALTALLSVREHLESAIASVLNSQDGEQK